MGRIFRLFVCLGFVVFFASPVFGEEREIFSVNWQSDEEVHIYLLDPGTVYKKDATTFYFSSGGCGFRYTTDHSWPAGVEYETKIRFYDRNSAEIDMSKRTSMPEYAKITIWIARKEWSILKLFEGWWETTKQYNHTLYVYRDNTAPTVTLTGGQSGGETVTTGSVSLSVSASDSGSGMDTSSYKYYYNGAYKTGKTLSLSAEGIHRVAFQAADKAGNIGQAITTVIIDRSAPEITISGGTGDSWSSVASLTLTASASDSYSGVDAATWKNNPNGGSYYYWSNQGAENNQLTISNEGSHSVSFKVKDRAGNEATGSATARIDRTPPSVSISGNMGRSWGSDTSRSLSLYASDYPAGIDYIESSRDLGATWTRETRTDYASITFSGEGSFIGIFRVWDRAGNSATISGIINLEQQPPVISNFTAPLGWVRPEVAFSGITVRESTQNGLVSGVNPETFTIIPQGYRGLGIPGTYNAATGLISDFTIALPDGNYNLTFAAADNAGNYAYSVIPTVKIDGTPPAFSGGVNGVPRRSGSGWSIPILLNDVSDPHSGIHPQGWRYAIDDGGEAAFTPSVSGDQYRAALSAGALAGGTHRITISGRDYVGNTRSEAYEFTIDDTPPAITGDPCLAASVDAAVWTNRSGFPLSAADAGSGLETVAVEIKRLLNGGWVNTGDAQFSENAVSFLPGAADGVFQITLAAADLAGNREGKTFYVKVDRSLPVLNLPSGISDSNAIAASASDAASGLDENSWEWAGGDGLWRGGSTAVLSPGLNQAFRFRVRDMAGNSVEKSGEITVDTSPPVLSAAAAAFAVGEKLLVSPLAVEDGISGVASVWYRIDGGEAIPVDAWPVTALEIPTAACGEGRRSLQFGARDRAGNTGQSGVYPFIIDRSPPEITAVEIREAPTAGEERVLGDFDFTAAPQVLIRPRGRDHYRDGESKGEGTITAWYWDLRGDIHETPEFLASRTFTDAAFTLGGYDEGINYLYIRGEDAGGNHSETFRRIISLDKSVPAAPVIRSPTHEEAARPEQAGFLPEAQFRFRPAGYSQSGITGYMWRVQKLILPGGEAAAELVSQGRIDDLDPESAAALSLTLGDNKENEFYRLTVQGRGGNGLTGLPGEYQFRIDSTAPNEIRIRANPQLNPRLWYHDRNTVVSWNKPADMTGVAEYRYWAGPEASYQSPNDGGDPPEWTKTAAAEVRLDLKNLLDGRDAGAIAIGVCAIDYAGNWKTGFYRIQNDYSPPFFQTKPGEAPWSVTDTPAEVGKAKHIAWVKPVDPESGVERITLGVTGGERTWSYTLEPEAGEFTLDRLDDDAVYTLTLRAYDYAGNVAELHQPCATGGAELPPQYMVPYQERINGFELSGSRVVSTGSGETLAYQDLGLDIPPAIALFEIESAGAVENRRPIQSLPLENLSPQGQLPAAARSRAGSFEAEADGFVIRGGGILFDRDRGVFLTGAVYTRKLEIAGLDAPRAINLGQTSLGIPPAAQFAGGPGFTEAPALLRSFSETGDGSIRPGFTLGGIETIQLRSGKEWFAGKALAVHTGLLADHGIHLTAGNGDYRLPLASAGAEGGSKNPEGDISINPEDPPRLILGGAEFSLVKAGIRGSSVTVYEATLKLPENYEPREVRLRNFILDGQNGTVTMGPDYQAGNIRSVSPNGAVFESSAIEFDLDGGLLVSGTVHSGAYGLMPFTDLPLSHTGLDWEAGARLRSLSVLVHGFVVNAGAARFTGEGLFIEQGTIALYGADRPFSNLGLTGVKADEIYAAGTIGEPYYAQTGYGSPLLISEGRIRSAGVFGTVTVPPHPEVQDAARRGDWEFANTRLYPSGLMFGVLESPSVLTIAGFSLNAEEVVLTGDSIRVGTLSPETIPGLGGDPAAFTDFEFNETKILVPGRASGNFVFQVAGWTLDYAGLRLDPEGMGGHGTLRLPSRLGGKSLTFPESLLRPDGNFSSGIAAPGEAAVVETGGLPLRMDGAVLAPRGDGYMLQSGGPFLSLKALAGPDLYFGETIFDAQGRVVKGEAGTVRVQFAAANGCRVDSDSYRVTDGGIRLEGSLGALWWDAEEAAAIGDGGIQLLPDYRVRGNAAEAEVSYQYGDWRVAGKNITFGEDTLTIKTNQVSYRGAAISLGEFAFDPQGLLRETVETSHEQEFPLVFGFGVTLTKTRFHREGVDAAVSVRLPSFLGNQDLEFAEIRLNADGMFSVEKNIEDLGFTLGGLEFAFRDISLDSAGVYAAAAELTLPAAQENRSLALQGLRISKDALTLEDAQISPFALWGMVFALDSFSITGEGIAMTGLLELPPLMPGELAGLSCEIREFNIGFDGQVHALDVYSQGTYTIPFLENWSLSINGPKVHYIDDQPWIVMEGGVLHFPAGYEAADAYIDQVRFNPVKGVFDYGSIYTDGDIALNLGGMEFVLTGLRIDPALAVSFGGTARFPSRGVPGCIAGKIVDIDVFEILKDGSLGNIAVFLDDLEGEVLPGIEGLRLENGAAMLIKDEGSSLLLSLTGEVILAADMPGPLAGSALHIEMMTIDLSVPAITRFQAETYLPDPVFLGNQFREITAGIAWDQVLQTGQLELAGLIKLPGSFPPFLAGQETVIKDFTIGFDGVIRTLSAEYSTAPGIAYDAFGALQLCDVFVDIFLSQERLAFELAGTAIFGADQFPRGIGGNRARVAMKFDTLRGLVYAAGSLAISDQKLFGALGLRDFYLGISKDESGPLYVYAEGKVLLPDSFPQGLRGMEVDIRRFTMDSAGGVTALDIGLSGVNTRIFGLAELKNGAMDFRLGEKDELLLAVEGTVRLNSSGLPPALRNTELLVNKLELSTKYGLKDFEVGLGSSLSFKILGGIQVYINSLFLDESCITLNAGLYLPAHYPEGLANTRIDLKTLKLDWNGGIVDIQGGLGAVNFTLAGFTVETRRLYFERDRANQFWVTLQSCRLRLPPHVGSLGSQYVTLRNARFSPDTGAFMGDLEATKLTTEIAGFLVEIKTPHLDLDQQRINCESAFIQTPAFLGNAAIALYGLRISAAEGLSLSGGGFRLPGFNVGGLAFSNVEVNFYSNETETSLGGGGSVFIPGAGTIDASLSFITKSSAYPLGLKQAEFSYTLAAGGIPLGSTGLFLNGIVGGITYGPPLELPWKVQGMFGSQGPRIKLGLHLGDAYGGTILDMSPVVWVDISNASWAFQGTATVLRGKLDIRSELTAALSAAGFYGGAAVELKFVRGGVDMYIFDKAGKVMFSGEGYVQFGLSRGAIVDTTVLFARILVPPVDMWLGSISAAFGPFTNGKTGFKGFVELPLLGQKGVFVAPGTFAIGDVSSYRVEKPSWAAPSLRGSRLPAEDTGSVAADMTDDPGPLIYQVLIPALSGEGEDRETGLERIVFLLAYTEGDPVLTLASPSGKEYREGSAKTETVFMENAAALIVYAPEPGIWNIRVENIGEEFFKLQVLGGGKTPQLLIDEPGGGVSVTTGPFRLRGTTDVADAAIVVHAREGRGKPGRELGTYRADQKGVFDAEVPVQDLPDGEYVISAQFETGERDVSPVAYAAGTILVDRSQLPLNMPGNVRAAETDAGVITLSWENTNGGRGINYKLRLRDQDTEEEQVYVTGNITTMTLPGYRAGQRLSFAAAALDEAGRESPYTPPVQIRVGAPPPVRNRPQIAEGRVPVEGRVGGFAEGSIPVTIADYQAAGDASGYLRARETGQASRDLGRVVFGGPIPVTGTEAAIPWYAGFGENIKPGTYTIQGEVINEANGGLSAPFSLEFRIDWPDPEIYALEPAEINGREAARISVWGRGFMPGTRVFWRDQELPLTPGAEPGSSTSLEFLLPPQAETGTFPVTIAGPGGQTATFPLTVVVPDWNINLYTQEAETLPGGSLSYALGIRGINGFEGNASFTLMKKPRELEVSLPVIPADALGAVGITVSPDAAPGTYTTTISGGPGKTFDLITLVREAAPEPHLTCYAPAVVFAGSEVRLYGYALGKDGELQLNGGAVETLSWTDSEIVFVVPPEGTSGSLRVLTAGGGSNALPFALRNRGFTIRPGVAQLVLSPGESRVIPIALSGYADTVYLRAEAEPGSPLELVLDKTALKPNGIINLTLQAGKSAERGPRKIVVRGKSGAYENAASITVRIQDALNIEGKLLPQALLGVSYYGKLESSNSVGETEYHLAGGELPPGLSLNRQGEIRGRPSREGSYPVLIEGRDEASRTGSASLVIQVREDPWARAAKDGGQSRFAGMELPAEKKEAWTAAGKEAADYLLAAEDHVLGLFPGEIRALRIADGSTAWSVPGVYRQLLYAGVLYALTSEDLLEARDIKTGALLWRREGIVSIGANHGLVLADGLVLDASRGTLVEQIPDQAADPAADPAELLWLDNSAYIIEENALRGVYGSDSFLETEGSIYAAAADAGGFALAGEKALILLDRDLREIRRIPRRNGPGVKLVLADDAVLLWEGGLLSEYRREDLALSWVREVQKNGSIAAGLDKAVIAGPEGLAVLNRSTGGLIWEDPRPFRGLALYREKIYAAGSDGHITAFSGPANLYPPEVEINIQPASPDGNNDWYISKPAVQFRGVDRETRVAELKMTLDEGEWQDAAETLILDDGEHRVSLYGTDSKGLRSREVRALIRVDTESPASEYTPSVPEPLNGWYREPLTLSLEAGDDLSGVDRIVSSRGTYTEALVFAEQGIHHFTWYAQDLAGNRETLRRKEIKIDYEAPFTEIHALQDQGVSEVSLSARDRLSGVDRIEYRINDGPVETYQEPLLFTREGRYDVDYRAVDKAGNYEEWRGADIWVTPNRNGVALINDPRLNGAPRMVLYHARNGMPLLRREGGADAVLDPAAPEALARLPSYTIGAEYLLWEKEDAGLAEGALLRFQVTRDAVVYLGLSPDREAPEGWSFVEEKAGINRTYYPRRAFYMRRYSGGAPVTISLGGEDTLPPLVLVQEWGPVFGEITIREDPETPAGESAASEFAAGATLVLEARLSPWTYSRRLPLRKRWLVNPGEGWLALDGETYTLPDQPGAGFVRFRLEVYSPGGGTEYQTEKTIYIVEKKPKEESL
jgi:hypothetical protein